MALSFEGMGVRKPVISMGLFRTGCFSWIGAVSDMFPLPACGPAMRFGVNWSPKKMHGAR